MLQKNNYEGNLMLNKFNNVILLHPLDVILDNPISSFYEKCNSVHVGAKIILFSSLTSQSSLKTNENKCPLYGAKVIIDGLGEISSIPEVCSSKRIAKRIVALQAHRALGDLRIKNEDIEAIKTTNSLISEEEEEDFNNEENLLLLSSTLCKLNELCQKLKLKFNINTFSEVPKSRGGTGCYLTQININNNEEEVFYGNHKDRKVSRYKAAQSALDSLLNKIKISSLSTTNDEEEINYNNDFKNNIKKSSTNIAILNEEELKIRNFFRNASVQGFDLQSRIWREDSSSSSSSSLNDNNLLSDPFYSAIAKSRPLKSFDVPKIHANPNGSKTMYKSFLSSLIHSK